MVIFPIYNKKKRKQFPPRTCIQPLIYHVEVIFISQSKATFNKVVYTFYLSVAESN